MNTKEKGYDVSLKLVAKGQKQFTELRDGIVGLRGIVYPELAFDTYARTAEFFENKKSFGVAAVLGTRVIGYLIGVVNKTTVEIFDIAVVEDLRRARIATDILGFLVARILASGEKIPATITTTVRERDVAVQLFLRAFGMKYKKTKRAFYNDTEEDGYVFKLLLPVPCRS